MEHRVHRGLQSVSANKKNASDAIKSDTIIGANFERKIVECREIPPERIGINGEYDHAGLSKRVRLLLSEQLTNSVEKTFVISQRGRVVVVIGPWVTDEMAQRITTLSLQVEGATSVELNGVHLGPRSRPIAHIESNKYFKTAS